MGSDKTVNRQAERSTPTQSPFEIPFSDIEPLVAALDLDKAAAAQLSASAYALVGWHLMPKMLVGLYGTSADSRARLLKIKKATASLSQAIDGLNPEYWVALELAAVSLAESRNSPVSGDLPSPFQLRALAEAANEAYRRLGAPGRGKSEDGDTLRTVR